MLPRLHQQQQQQRQRQRQLGKLCQRAHKPHNHTQAVNAMSWHAPAPSSCQGLSTILRFVCQCRGNTGKFLVAFYFFAPCNQLTLMKLRTLFVSGYATVSLCVCVSVSVSGSAKQLSFLFVTHTFGATAISSRLSKQRSRSCSWASPIAAKTRTKQKPKGACG